MLVCLKLIIVIIIIIKSTTVAKEPSAHRRQTSRRQDFLIPWRAGKPVVRDVTVVCTCTDSYVEASDRQAGAAAELAATRKMAQYSDLSDQYTFYPVAV